MGKEFIVVANWKMHKTVAEAILFLETLTARMPQSQEQITLVIAPPFTALFALYKTMEKKHIPWLLAAQNMHEMEKGAFTGEISATMLKELGVTFVILGHSERRNLFFESDALVNKKVNLALKENLRPILCVGETLEEKKGGKRETVLERQLYCALEEVMSLDRVILAYEPVWAIGTGEHALPEEVQQVFTFCRKVLAKRWGEKAARDIPILYGGSVTPKNSADFVKLPSVDGLLVGGASLTVESFSEIISLCHYNPKGKLGTL